MSLNCRVILRLVGVVGMKTRAGAITSRFRSKARDKDKVDFVARAGVTEKRDGESFQTDR